MLSRRLLGLSVGLTVLSAGMVPGAAASPPEPSRACSPSSSLIGFSDALNKTQLDGHAVAGLSSLSPAGPGRTLALADNMGTTPARFFDLSLRPDPASTHGLRAAANKVTTLKRPDGTPYNGTDFDGESLVLERGGRTLLAGSETEPSIRRFQRSDGRQTGELPVPPRFRVAPAGEAAANQTFESLAVTPDGRTVYAGMEGPLSADAPGPQRIIRYQGRPGGAYTPAAQYAYQTDSSLSLVELVALNGGGLLALERGFTSGVGNTIRVYQTSTRGARDVSNVASLASTPGVAIKKRLVVDLVTCPPSGATAPQPQPNTLLDNVEGMALGGPAAGGRHVLYLVSDDNGNANQTTRLYALAVDLR
jgi:hypothetical protein